ncbi:hypothetical protein KCU90_g244, partial [Aureobasidium melanogenum]
MSPLRRADNVLVLAASDERPNETASRPQPMTLAVMVAGTQLAKSSLKTLARLDAKHPTGYVGTHPLNSAHIHASAYSRIAANRRCCYQVRNKAVCKLRTIQRTQTHPAYCPKMSFQWTTNKAMLRAHPRQIVIKGNVNSSSIHCLYDLEATSSFSLLNPPAMALSTFSTSRR